MPINMDDFFSKGVGGGGAEARQHLIRLMENWAQAIVGRLQQSERPLQSYMQDIKRGGLITPQNSVLICVDGTHFPANQIVVDTYVEIFNGNLDAQLQGIHEVSNKLGILQQLLLKHIQSVIDHQENNLDATVNRPIK